MKFLDLRLIAYGPFRDAKLAFEPDPLGLHMIYGPNEAGKSTALRAVKGVLYGIPGLRRTRTCIAAAIFGSVRGSSTSMALRSM